MICIHSAKGHDVTTVYILPLSKVNTPWPIKVCEIIYYLNYCMENICFHFTLQEKPSAMSLVFA